jgi:hypothetical protein
MRSSKDENMRFAHEPFKQHLSMPSQVSRRSRPSLLWRLSRLSQPAAVPGLPALPGLPAIRLGLALAVLAGALGVVATLPAAAATLDERFDQTFPLAAGGALQIGNTNGAITIEAWDRDEARVEALKEVKGRSDSEAKDTMRRLQIVATPGAGSLRIDTRYPSVGGGFFDWLFHGNVHAKVTYRLHVPRRVQLTARTVNGGVTLTGTRGKAVLETTNGTLTVAEVDGPLELESTNGNIVVRHAAGALRAETTNGSVEAELTRLDGQLSLESTNGALTVRLPSGVRATLDAETTNGSVRSDLPVTTTAASSRHLRGAINGGGQQLKLSTTNGGIRILAL